MLRQFASVCVTVVTLLSAPFAASAQDRFALVIGNSKYKGVSPLTNPARDAAAVSALLKEAGFEVTSALDLDKASMSRSVRFFATSIAEKPEKSVALIYFAGHGVQVDGENFLLPVDASVTRESDVPLEAMRLGDLMAMLETVRSKTRIVILDACRDNPFADLSKTAPRGLALVNAPAGTLLAYSTSPGHTADDGTGNNSPFAAALLKSAKEPGLPIETALKNVRLAVHGATDGRQTPWEVSALIEPFAFFPGSGPLKKDPNAGKSAETWRKDMQGLKPRDAFALTLFEDNVIVYEQYLAVFPADPLAVTVRSILERRQMMMAWQEAVALGSEAGFAAFLARYPNSDLSATARRMQQRAQSRLAMTRSLPSVLGLSANAANPQPEVRTVTRTVEVVREVKVPQEVIRVVNVPGPACNCGNPGSPNSPTRASTPVVPLVPVLTPTPGGPPRIVDPGRPSGSHTPDRTRGSSPNHKSDSSKSGKSSGSTTSTNKGKHGSSDGGRGKRDSGSSGKRDKVSTSGGNRGSRASGLQSGPRGGNARNVSTHRGGPAIRGGGGGGPRIASGRGGGMPVMNRGGGGMRFGGGGGGGMRFGGGGGGGFGKRR